MTTQATPELKATFSDAKGREFEVRLDYAKLRRIRDALGVDLGNVEEMGRTWALLLYDDLKALDVVWAAIVIDPTSNVAAHGTAQDDWLGAMDGEVLVAARSSLKAAIYRFTQPLKRSILDQGLAAVQETYERAIAEAEERVGAAIDKSIERATAAMHGPRRLKSQESSVTLTTAGASATPSRR